jgi:predicted nuclease of predicted toxin-antitoxin system
MKILLDECLPIDFRHHLPGHEVHTAEWAGFKGVKNGLLLQLAESAGYEVLLTVDQGVPHQQNLVDRKISVLVIRPVTNQMEDLLPMVAAILEALSEVRPGHVAIAT